MTLLLKRLVLLTAVALAAPAGAAPPTDPRITSQGDHNVIIGSARDVATNINGPSEELLERIVNGNRDEARRLIRQLTADLNRQLSAIASAQKTQRSLAFTDGAMEAFISLMMGKKFPQDNVRAYMWLNISKTGGSTIAQKFIDQLQPKLTSSEIAKATALGESCRRSQFAACF